jgi:hypothetical protein
MQRLRSGYAVAMQWLCSGYATAMQQLCSGYALPDLTRMALTMANLTQWHRRGSIDSDDIDDSSLDLDGIGDG